MYPVRECLVSVRVWYFVFVYIGCYWLDDVEVVGVGDVNVGVDDAGEEGAFWFSVGVSWVEVAVVRAAVLVPITPDSTDGSGI